MGYKVDLTGKKFGRLTVIRETDQRKSGSVVWECKCDCGNTVFVSQNHLSRGATVSCGCYNAEKDKTHGMSHTHLHTVWACMKDRCLNPNHPQFKDYGGRGIKICDEWLDSSAFIEWAKENGYREDERGKCTLDRIDVNGNYEPSNCRWVSMKEQCRNRRNNVIIEYNGEKHCLSEWAEILKVPYSRLQSRRRRGWSTREMLFGRV